MWISALSLNKKQSSTYQYRHGGRWFQGESSSHCELAAKECTRMYILWRACGCFLYAPSIYPHLFKRLTESLFDDMPLLRKNYSSTYHSRHGCRWHYAVTSLPRKLAAQEYTRMYILGRGCPWFLAAASFS